MRRGRVVLGLLFVLGLGFISWPVSRPLSWLCQTLEGRSGWHLSVARARWTPWRFLDLAGVELQTPGGGRVQVREIRIRPVPFSLILGNLLTRWALEEIRIDPGSWGIHRPLAQELLSAGPVVQEGRAVVQVGWDDFRLKEMKMEGTLVQLQAEGRITPATHQVLLELNGALARRLLEEMNLIRSEDKEARLWEPFTARLHGEVSHPDLFFASSFLSLSSKRNGEKGS